MKSLWRMTRFVRPYRWVMIIGLLLVVLPVAMELVVPSLLQYIVDKGIRANDMSVIIRGSLIMLASAVVGAIATLGQGFYRARLSQGTAFDMRNEMFTHIQALSFANLDEMQTGQLMTRLSSDVDVVKGFVSAGLALILRAGLMIMGSVILLLMTDLQLSLIVILLLILAAILIRIIMQTATPLFSVVQQKLSALNTILQENLAGTQVVKAFFCLRQWFIFDLHPLLLFQLLFFVPQRFIRCNMLAWICNKKVVSCSACVLFSGSLASIMPEIASLIP
ncbi:MAG: ABC transporter transmembrane domain-containing protein [Chloroflexi bacterium]|nr:ABC transporter transmembrane domain-containing protein [Chloroflexota bacterium]